MQYYNPPQQPAPRYSQYIQQNLLGEGNFAKVYRVIHRTNYAVFAAKIMTDSKVKSNAKVLELMHSEIRILQTIKNDNVIKLHEYFFENGNHFLVMEFCNGGDLEKYVKGKPNKVISEAEALGFFKQLLNGFKALHEIKAMHRDFKLANVLINDGTLKIADLGFSKQGVDLTKTALGTGLYMAPEIMRYQTYDNKVDIWSLGVCLYEMLFGEPPFIAKSEMDLLKKAELNNINFNFKGISISPQLQELIKRMLTVDPKRRIEWIEIYNHPILNEPKPVVGAGGLGNSIFQMKKKDLSKQHQDMTFQQNKDFYQKKQNVQYDVQESYKVIEKYANAGPIREEPGKEDEKYNPRHKYPNLNENLNLPLYRDSEEEFEKIDGYINKGAPGPSKKKEGPGKNINSDMKNLDSNKTNVVLPNSEIGKDKQGQKGYWDSQEKYIPPGMQTKNKQGIFPADPSPQNKNFQVYHDQSPRNNCAMDDNEILKGVSRKNELMQLYESKYLHWRNIICHHAKVLGDGFNFNFGKLKQPICMYFIFSKVIILKSKEFFENLKSRKNFLKIQEFFKDFTNSDAYMHLIPVFEEEKDIYRAYFDQLLSDAKALGNKTLVGEFNENSTKQIDSLYRETLLDFLCIGMEMVSTHKKEGKLDLAKKLAFHLIELLDCYSYEKVFAFDEKEENGFNFDNYEAQLNAHSLKNLEDMATEKMSSLLA